MKDKPIFLILLIGAIFALGFPSLFDYYRKPPLLIGIGVILAVCLVAHMYRYGATKVVSKLIILALFCFIAIQHFLVEGSFEVLHVGRAIWALTVGALYTLFTLSGTAKRKDDEPKPST